MTFMASALIIAFFIAFMAFMAFAFIAAVFIAGAAAAFVMAFFMAAMVLNGQKEGQQRGITVAIKYAYATTNSNTGMTKIQI